MEEVKKANRDTEGETNTKMNQQLPYPWPLPPVYGAQAPGFAFPTPGYYMPQPMPVPHAHVSAHMHTAARSVPADHFPTVEDELTYLDSKYTGKAFRNYKRFIDVITSVERMDFYYIDGFVRYIRQRTSQGCNTAQTLIKVLNEANETISLGMANVLINHFECKFDEIEKRSLTEFDF